MIRYLGLYVITFAGMIAGATTNNLSFLTPLSNAVLLFGSIGLWRLDARPFRELGFPKGVRWLSQLALSTLAGIVIVFLFMVIAVLTGLTTITLKQEISASLPPLIFRTFVYTALIAASEEIVYRGVYFRVIRTRYVIIVAALASAALWSAVHLPGIAADGALIYQLIIGLLTFTAFGAALAFATMLARGSLWIAIGVHYGYNLAFSSLGAFFSTELSGPPFLTGAPGWFPETAIIGLIVWTLIATSVYALFKRTAPAG